MKPSVAYSRYGAQYNVRADYDSLPGQAFWTWITGKGRILREDEKRRAMRPVSTGRTTLDIAFSWALIAFALWMGDSVLSSDSAWVRVLGVSVCWLIIVNRGRCLQATFHYMTHGSAMPARSWAEALSMLAFSAPFLYEGWSSYAKTHVGTHHHLRILCTDSDPDQRFLARQGIRPGISEARFWFRVWTRPFMPGFLWETARQCLSASLRESTRKEMCARLAVLGAMGIVTLAAGWFDHWLLLFGVPAWLLLRHSLWLQLLTEHLWFPPASTAIRTPVAYGQLTWGRFQGRPLPGGSPLAWARWLAELIFLDLPVRLYIYPQDLPNHDFHHRFPLAPYDAIADLRRTAEGELGRFGPSCEVWGFLSNLRLLRDHLCRGQSDPFSLRLPAPRTLPTMEHIIDIASRQISSQAFARLDGRDLFSAEELQFLHRSCEVVPKELIRIGDVGEENHLDVGRFMEDRKGQLPAYRNTPLGQEVVDHLNRGRCRELLTAVMGGEFFIRRCQANVLKQGSFIGKHIDTYSNLDYRYSCVIQFGRHYEGGEFFVEFEGQEREIRTGYAEFLINRCEIPHGVRRVHAGNRTSLVFFLSESPLSRPNTHHKQI